MSYRNQNRQKRRPRMRMQIADGQEIREEDIIYLPSLSPCSRLYLKASTNPFDEMEQLPCVPDFISLPSYKFGVRTRVNFTVGTLGTGWVAANPYASATSDQNCIAATNATYNLQTFDLGASLTMVNMATSDSPFTFADYANQQFRVVGAGVRVKYAGPALTRGGDVLLFRQPDNEGLQSPANFSDFLAFRSSTRVNARETDEGWRSVSYRPSEPQDLGYQELSLTNMPYTLLIMVVGATPGITWQVDYVAYFETIGNRNHKTASHSDPVGLGVVQQSLPVTQSPDTPRDQEHRALEMASHIIGETATGILPFLAKAAPVIGGALGSMIGPEGTALGSVAGEVVGEGISYLSSSSTPLTAKHYSRIYGNSNGPSLPILMQHPHNDYLNSLRIQDVSDPLPRTSSRQPVVSDV